MCMCVSCLAVSNSLQTHELARLFYPWNSPGKITEWVAIPFSRGSPWCRDQTHVSWIAGKFFTIWTTREVPQILYINVYIWNLERWYWWSSLQGSKGDTDVKNRLLATVGVKEGGMTWESSIETYTLPYVKQIRHWGFSVWYREPKAHALGQPKGMGWGGMWEEREHMCACGWLMLVYDRNHNKK